MVGWPRVGEHVGRHDIDPAIEPRGRDRPPRDPIDGRRFKDRRPGLGKRSGDSDRIRPRSTTDVEQSSGGSARQGRCQSRPEHTAAAVHGGSERLRERLGPHRGMPVGLALLARPVGGTVGSQHREEVGDARLVGDARVVGPRVERPARHEEFPCGVGDMENAAVVDAPQEAVGDQERAERVCRSRVNRKLPADGGEIGRVVGERREEVEMDDRRGERINRGERFSVAVDRCGVGHRCVRHGNVCPLFFFNLRSHRLR